MVRPLSASFCWKPIIQGISTRHGSHQGAQKFTITTLPFRPDSETSWPCRFLKVTSGSSGCGPLFASDLPLSALEILDPPRESQPEKLVVTIIATNISNRK